MDPVTCFDSEGILFCSSGIIFKTPLTIIFTKFWINRSLFGSNLTFLRLFFLSFWVVSVYSKTSQAGFEPARPAPKPARPFASCGIGQAGLVVPARLSDAFCPFSVLRLFV